MPAEICLISPVGERFAGFNGREQSPILKAADFETDS